jgi:hypothetical protein
MDDYNVNVLSEAKNEYSCRLLSILTPVVSDGVKSIFNDAERLCIENDEVDKYLMTFQNFLSRVPKWNETMINEETTRIIGATGCNYLEDLITCVHIAQLKVLTSVRVSQKQKKIDLDIPKIATFIHQVYSVFARKLYKNVYLFEKIITPLQYQKNMRECELLCKESILEVIRSSIPVEKILRSYIDETVDEEVVHEISEQEIEKEVDETAKNTDNVNNDTNNNDTNNDVNKETEDFSKTPILKLEKNEVSTMENNEVSTIENNEENNNISMSSIEPTSGLTFNDVDSVLDMGTNKEEEIDAPKTIDRLEKISEDSMKRRKEEEAEDEDYDDDNLEIFDDSNIKLDIDDLGDLSNTLKLDTPILLDDIEVLN